MKVDAIKQNINLISKYNQICNNYKTSEQPCFSTNNFTRQFGEKQMENALLDFKS